MCLSKNSSDDFATAQYTTFWSCLSRYLTVLWWENMSLLKAYTLVGLTQFLPHPTLLSSLNECLGVLDPIAAERKALSKQLATFRRSSGKLKKGV